MLYYMFYMYDLDDLLFPLDQDQLYETNTLLVSVHSQSYNQPHYIWRRGWDTNDIPARQVER